MKKLSILFLLLLLAIVSVKAQNANREKLDAYRVGFFTKKLNLTSEEAERFWPAYNDYQKKKTELLRERVMMVRDFNQNESSLSEKELTQIGDNLIATISRENEMAQDFHKRLKELLSPAKVIRYYQAENQWKAQLLNELQENRPAQRQNQKF
ncbi:MAG: hypothetical protein IPN68_17270 [Bacteroidetes bacterium]|nr:hypothetical protein [Bacteroidota bacterium]